MKKISILPCICTAVILLCSCVRDHTELDNGRNPGMTITFSKDGLDTGITTRSKIEPTPEEETVNTILIMFYEASDSYDGAYVTSIIMNDGPYNMDQSYDISDPLLSSNTAYNVIAIANIDDDLYINGNLEQHPELYSHLTEKQYREQFVLDISFPSETTGIGSDRIPMTGSVSKEAGKGKIDLRLKRIVSRLDVVSSVAGYQIESVSVWNAYYRSSILGDALMDYSPVAGSRTKKYYDGTVENNSVTGNLYVFENQVASPSQNDRFTTCLIIGLSQGGLAAKYFRVNINPKGSPQHLKRNNSYRVNITAVNGEGAGSEEEAYTGINNELAYTINYWDLDDNGLIVSDINSMMALPVKTATFGRVGGENSYTIVTFSNLTSPAPLAIKSQIYTPADGSILATLQGNILTVTAKEMTDGAADRTGIITLTYGGLEANMNVLQSSSVDKFLTVTLDDGWLSELPATANASSENIFVNASGPWTAKLYDGGQGDFTLQAGVMKTELPSIEAPTNKFRISTFTQNSTQSRKEAFVLVTLDGDHLNYVSVIQIAQKAPSAINIVPDVRSIVFDAAGNVENSTNRVYSLTVTTNGANLMPSSLEDDTYFSINEATVNSTSSKIEITAKGANFTTSAYTTTLTIKDNSGGSRQITVTQNSGGLYLRPSTISTQIPAVGGTTEYITVDAGGGTLAWSATITTEGTNGDIYNHPAHLELSDGSYVGPNPTGISTAVKFRIVFPKVYYPNRRKNISAKVTVTLDNTPLTAEITASQQPLTQRGMDVWSSSGVHYGSIATNGQSFNRYFKEEFFSNASGMLDRELELTNGAGTGVNNRNPGGYMAFNLVNICNSGMPGNYDWSLITAYLEQKDGLTIFASEGNGGPGLNAINGSPLATRYGFSVVSSPSVNGYNNNAAKNTRVYQVLTNLGRNPIPEGGTVGPLIVDGVATGATVIPATGIKIIQYGNPNNNATAMLVIDPTNGYIYSGESSWTYSLDNMRAGENNWNFLRNYIDFIYLATLYGSHFMDMLIDYGDNDPQAVAPPWDNVWGANKWDHPGTPEEIR